MRILLITLTAICISLGLKAQINIPLSNRPIITSLGDSVVTVGTFPSNTGQNDVYETLSKRFPTFVAEDGYITYQGIQNAWNSRTKLINEGNIRYKSLGKYWSILSNRNGVALREKYLVYRHDGYEPLTPIETLYFLFKYKVDNGISNNAFWNNSQVDSVMDLLNPVIPPQDTTVQDSIQ